MIFLYIMVAISSGVLKSLIKIHQTQMSPLRLAEHLEWQPGERSDAGKFTNAGFDPYVSVVSYYIT